MLAGRIPKEESRINCMRCVVLAPLFVVAASAQRVTDPARLPAAVREFDAKQVHASLQCTVEPIKPALNLEFRFQTGYVLRAPLNPDHGGARRWYLAFRVTPEGGRRQSVYF